MIDKVYLVMKYVLIAALIVSIANLIFREIRHSSVMGNILVRRFLPIVRFIITAAIWVIALFALLDSLHINTYNILAWAWIGWVLFALAGKDIVTNLFWSLSILLSRTFDIGESIRVYLSRWNIYEWIVEEITLNYTKITSVNGEVVFIPNRIVYAEVIENISRQRFKAYTYIVPFRKNSGNPEDIKKQLKIIEGKIYEYSPIWVHFETENPNSNDFVYRITAEFPDENEIINREIQDFLVDFIFPKEKKETENI
jgi:small-conductance mechanosensitive channel